MLKLKVPRTVVWFPLNTVKASATQDGYVK